MNRLRRPVRDCRRIGRSTVARPPSRALPLTLTLVAFGCGADEAGEDARGYVRSSYAERSRVDAASMPVFTDVTVESGIDFVHYTGAYGDKLMPETVGSGVAVLDYDADAAPDLLFVNSADWPGRETGGPPPTMRLYRNRIGATDRTPGSAGTTGPGGAAEPGTTSPEWTWEDVTAAAGLQISVYGMGATVADYDADGDSDIYVTAIGPNLLLRNDDGVFTERAREAGVAGSAEDGRSWSTAAAWLDYDLDGWIDLFQCGYVQWTPETDIYTTIDGVNKSYSTPEQYAGDTCRLYRNRGDGTFADVTARTGVRNPEGKSLGVAIADPDEDGWPDIFVANDTQRNFLYMNDRGTFTDIAVRAGVAYDEIGRARAGMGIDVAEIGGRGRWAIVIGNFAEEPLSLFTRIGDGLYQDRAGRARLTRASLVPLTFGVLFADLDLDADLDLLVANGHIEPTVAAVRRGQSFEQSPQLFLGDGKGVFAEIGSALGPDFAAPMVARGLVANDLDRDGDLDVVFTANGGRPRVLRNDSPSGNRISLRLRGLHPNLDALGALLEVHAGGRIQRRYVAARTSYLSHSRPNPALFGLGAGEFADSVVVIWPQYGPEGERAVTVLREVRAGSEIDVTQPPRAGSPREVRGPLGNAAAPPGVSVP